MDLLASFLFGAATLTSIKTLGIEGKKELIRTCLCAGLIAAFLLAVIYYFLGYAGAEAHRYLSGEFSNGAGILVATAHEYLGGGGTFIPVRHHYSGLPYHQHWSHRFYCRLFPHPVQQKAVSKNDLASWLGTSQLFLLQLRAGYDHQDGDSRSVLPVSGDDCPGLAERVRLRR